MCESPTLPLLNLLPLCRKEKYFTSCLLPQVICGDRLERLSRFLEMLQVPSEFIREHYDHDNLVLYTEYSLKESARWKKARELETKETPDLVLLLRSRTGDRVFLLVIEAKVYSKTDAAQFRAQLNAQKKIIEAIISHHDGLIGDNVLHVGLLLTVPQGLRPEPRERLITWSDVVSLYTGSLQDNYFFRMLAHAAQRFDLVSKGKASSGLGKKIGRNYRGKLSLDEIVAKCRAEGDAVRVGVHGGAAMLRATPLEGLRRRHYKWDYASDGVGKKKPNNWLSGTRFLEILKEISGALTEG